MQKIRFFFRWKMNFFRRFSRKIDIFANPTEFTVKNEVLIIRMRFSSGFYANFDEKWWILMRNEERESDFWSFVARESIFGCWNRELLVFRGEWLKMTDFWWKWTKIPDFFMKNSVKIGFFSDFQPKNGTKMWIRDFFARNSTQNPKSVNFSLLFRQKPLKIRFFKRKSVKKSIFSPPNH